MYNPAENSPVQSVDINSDGVHVEFKDNHQFSAGSNFGLLNRQVEALQALQVLPSETKAELANAYMAAAQDGLMTAAAQHPPESLGAHTDRHMQAQQDTAKDIASDEQQVG